MNPHRLISVLVMAALFAATSLGAQTTPAAGPWDIAVDVGAGATPATVTPTKPVARIGDDDYLAIQILVDGKVPDGQARLVFAQRVLNLTTTDEGPSLLAYRSADAGSEEPFTEHGASHLLRFRKCNEKYLSHFTINGRRMTRDDCPLIIADGIGNLTVYANTDSIALDAQVDFPAARAGDKPTVKHGQFTIRTVRPWWNLNFSTGFSFFAGDQVRDDQFRFDKIADDPATPNVDESNTTDRRIVSTGHGETPYELGAFATYMLHRPTNLPVGLTFGVSTKIPVDQLTALAGVSVRIEPFPIVNSAYVSAGIAYRSHKVLMAKYRDTLRAPAGVSEADILESRHDIGVVVAVSFGFGGGEAQFKKVVSGQ